MSRSNILRSATNASRSKRAAIACLLVAATLGNGCTRKYWREQADDLSYQIIEKKETDPRWTVPRIDLTADPRSRFYDAFDPDFTPLPPDDPTAHEYMHWVYGMNGYRKWHDFGDLPAVENPDWLDPFGLSPEVVAANYSRSAVLPQIEKLTLEEAIELSWIHSRDYQSQVENVYLVALALTFQRFRFDLQFVGIGGDRPSSEVNFEDVPNTGDSINWGNSVGVRQLFPSGAQFIAELSNNTLWLFSGGKSDSTASVLSYSLVQPLLAGGGRRFVLEGLTQAERSMLYALRDLARFRMGFFTSTVAGGTTAGLTSGVFGVATSVNPLTTPVSQGGYLGLLLQVQTIFNQQYNIRQLKERLDRLHVTANQRPDELAEDLIRLPEALAVIPPDGSIALRRREFWEFKEGALPEKFKGRIRFGGYEQRLSLRGTITDEEEQELLSLSDDLDWQRAIADLADRSIQEIETTNQQIAQLQTQLALSCNGLRTARVQLQDLVDRYKLFLGLPPDMPVTIDDSLLKPFELIDPRLIRLQDRLNNFVKEPAMVSDSHPDIEAIRRVRNLFDQLDSVNPDAATLAGLIAEMQTLEQDIERDGVAGLEADFRRYDESLKNRPPKPPSDDCLQVYRDEEADLRLKSSLLAAYRESVAQLDKLKVDVGGENLTEVELRRILRDISDVREDYLKTTQSLSVVQINLRVDMINLNRFEIDRDQAVSVALENRMDLMNARAAVMDARRLVEVTANQLQAVLNIVAAGDVRTQGTLLGNGNPFDFRGDQSSLRAGVQFTSPVQLVQQRNDYRAALIAYQRARRNYMRIEDQVKIDIRVTWRQLNVLKQNFETARENVRAATAQLDITVDLASAPILPGAGGAAGAQNNAAGLNTLNALNSVLTAQNQIIQIWVSYETNRLNIYNFMGTMEIDEYGFWVDDFYQSRADAARAGRSVDDCPPDLPANLTPPSPPQELKNDQTPLEVDPLPPQPAARRTAPRRIDAGRNDGGGNDGGPNVAARRDERVQLAGAQSEASEPASPRPQTWPDRPAEPAPRRRGKAARGAAGVGDSGRRGGVRLD
ncbi:MAG: hypothetical protein EXS05_02340 [Planctomycetaceae bacterium]|nr:hypothetical protein [Planctomycetaceae bacterium]